MRNLQIIISILFIMLSTQCIGMKNNNSNSAEATYIGKLTENSISEYEINTPNKKSSRDLRPKLVLPNFLTKEIIKYLPIKDLKKLVEIGDTKYKSVAFNSLYERGYFKHVYDLSTIDLEDLKDDLDFFRKYNLDIHNMFMAKGLDKQKSSDEFNIYAIKFSDGNDEIISRIFSDKRYNFNFIQNLDLSGNEIGVKGTAALAKSRTLTNLTSLDLNSNNIRDTGQKP